MGTALKKLMKEHHHYFRSHRCDISKEDYSRFEPYKDLLKRLLNVRRSSFAVYDLHRNKYLLRNREFYKKLGYADGEGTEKDIPESHIQLIHTDDLAFVLDTEIRVFCFFKNLPPSEKQNYKLVYDFRVKNTIGVYMRFAHQVVVLEQDKYGTSWLVLITTELVAEKATDKPPQRSVINIKTNKLHLFNGDDDCNPERVLTDRETEILQLVAQGLESRQIAERLFISINTVNNHRQNIIRKTNTKTTMQAVIFAKRMGII